MQLVTIVLNKVEVLEDLLESFSDNGIYGATILESQGMAHALSETSDMSFMFALRSVLNPTLSESRTIFLVAEDEDVKKISRVTNEVTGGLDQPDTGILFALPVTYTEGLMCDHD